MLALVGYSLYLEKSAEHLINSMREVRTTADAQRLIVARALNRIKIMQRTRLAMTNVCLRHLPAASIARSWDTC
jgi:hypothetical protein